LLFEENLDAFNIDTKAPIIKRGKPESYFGYSVSPHFIHNPTSGIVQPVILVGAPRDNITDTDAPQSVRKLIRPGLVYQCPITSSQSDCIDVKIDREEPDEEDDKNEQWMGVSVASQGTENGKAIVCAHRFRLSDPRGAFRWGLGQCITLTNSLDEGNFLQPCSGRDMNTQEGGFLYGFCQAGTSAAVSKNSNDILIGAPGPFNWRGAVFRNTFSSGSMLDDSLWYQTPVEDRKTSVNGADPAVPFYSYFGMSVKIANISGIRWYIGGAPRSERFGQVLMFRPPARQLHYTIEPQHVLTGFQFGASFGYDIAVADFNGDRQEDLVVSAPFYHAHGIGGAIYVYYNTGTGITSLIEPQNIYSRKMKDAECAQLNCHDARFGLALAAIGDVDRDGFQDLAVGAPYEGSGAVYIFRGSSHGIIPQFSQRIYASDLVVSSPTPLRAFGAALAGHADIDGNGYPDVIVGSFAGHSVAILRSRPVVSIRTAMSVMPARIDRKETQCLKDGTSNICFEIRVCFMFTAEPQDRFSGRLAVEYQLDAEKLSTAKFARAMFPQKAQTEYAVVNGSALMYKQSLAQPMCNTHLVYVSKSNRDFLNPILILLTYRLEDRGDPVLTPGRPIEDINSYPVINREAAHANFSVDFAQNCGDDHLCNSSLTMKPSLSLQRNTAGMYVLRVGQQQEMTLTVPVHNAGEEAHQTLLTVELPETISFIGMADGGSSAVSCSPVDNVVQCTLGNPLVSGGTVVAAVKFDVSAVPPSRLPINILVTVNTTSIEADKSDNTANISFIVTVEADLSLRGRSVPEQVFFGGTVLGESAVEFDDQIGSIVRHRYEVRNEGKISVKSSKLIVEFPYELASESDEHGKHVLYLFKQPILLSDGRTKGFCVFDPDWVNPVHIKTRSRLGETTDTDDDDDESEKVEEDSSVATQAIKEKVGEVKTDNNGRRRRDTGALKSKTVVNLNCLKPDVKCRKIVCTLGDMAPGSGVTLKLYTRLWNHTFVEEFADVDRVLITSHAEVKIDESLNIDSTNTDNDIIRLTTVALPDILIREKEGVPLWIIIVAVIAGVLLLILLILLLWKCGFFNRRRGGDKAQLQAKRLKANEDNFD